MLKALGDTWWGKETQGLKLLAHIYINPKVER